MDTSGITEKLSGGSQKLARLPVRKKLALILATAVLGAVVLDVGGPANSATDEFTASENEQDEFSEIESLLATFDDVESQPVRECFSTEEDKDDLTGMLTMQSPSELTVPDTSGTAVQEISHSEPFLTIPEEIAVAGSAADTGNSAPDKPEVRSPIRLTGTIYPAH